MPKTIANNTPLEQIIQWNTIQKPSSPIVLDVFHSIVFERLGVGSPQRSHEFDSFPQPLLFFYLSFKNL
ncbi:hypothetical protein LguiB_010846 [Lonicera macranthoides]